MFCFSQLPFSAFQQLFRDVWALNLETFRWRKLEARLPQAVYFHSAAVSPVNDNTFFLKKSLKKTVKTHLKFFHACIITAKLHLSYRAFPGQTDHSTYSLVLYLYFSYTAFFRKSYWITNTNTTVVYVSHQRYKLGVNFCLNWPFLGLWKFRTTP